MLKKRSLREGATKKYGKKACSGTPVSTIQTSRYKVSDSIIQNTGVQTTLQEWCWILDTSLLDIIRHKCYVYNYSSTNSVILSGDANPGLRTQPCTRWSVVFTIAGSEECSHIDTKFA